MHAYVCACVFVCVYVCVRVYCVHACVCVCLYVRIKWCRFFFFAQTTSRRLHNLALTLTHRHTYTHTHTRTSSLTLASSLANNLANDLALASSLALANTLANNLANDLALATSLLSLKLTLFVHRPLVGGPVALLIILYYKKLVCPLLRITLLSHTHFKKTDHT